MNSVIDYSLVGLVLLLSTAYAATSLGPRSLRPRLLAAFGRMLAGLPAVLGLKGISQRLAHASTVNAKGACGGCDNCGSAPAAAAAGQSAHAQSPPERNPPTQRAPPAEVRVPVAKIGRRI
jgi:hypothetical protein